jgi:vacuolar-type H+-ATPase subunit B/Vma2
MQRTLIKDYIEKMDKNNQLEILRIISQDETICLNENSNGTFINLTNVNDDTIEKITDFIKYITNQQIQLNKIECQREILTNKFFKDNKDNKDNIEEHDTATTEL